MANTAKNAILRAKLAGVLTDLMPKTITDNVYVNDTTTLTAYLATLATNANLETLQNAVDALGALAQKDKVSQSDLDDALAELIDAKASNQDLQREIARSQEIDSQHTDAIAELTTNVGINTNVINILVGEDSGKSVRTIANEELAAQLIGDDAKDSLDTLEEIAAWIQAHPDDASAMNAAITALQAQLNGIDAGNGTVKKYIDDAITALKIGDYAKAADLTTLAGRVTALENGKADKATTLAGYGITDAYTNTQVDQKIADAVSDATGGESAASVKASLEAYQTSNDARVTELESKKHEHANKTVLDGISAANVTAWNGKSKIFYSAEEPADLAEGDLWVALVD